jgi:hypothetical protein
MASGQERRKHARSSRRTGNVSRYAQQRVDRRVMEVMAHRDAAARREFAFRSSVGRQVLARS